MAHRNNLLAKLSREELEIISPDLEPVQLPFKYVMYAPFEPIEHVFFINRGVASMVNEPDTGEIVEFALRLSAEGKIVLPGASSEKMV